MIQNLCELKRHLFASQALNKMTKLYGSEMKAANISPTIGRMSVVRDDQAPMMCITSSPQNMVVYSLDFTCKYKMQSIFWPHASERPHASILLFKEQRFLTGPATSPCQDFSLYVHTSHIPMCRHGGASPPWFAP